MKLQGLKVSWCPAHKNRQKTGFTCIKSVSRLQEGSFRLIEPEAIKAQDGDRGIDMTLNYSISAGKQQQMKASNSTLRHRRTKVKNIEMLSFFSVSRKVHEKLPH